MHKTHNHHIQQTETLKLLFVLYFSILKATHPTPLLPCALEGISKFAHLVNIDFFKDLLQVLKKLIQEDDEEDDELISSTHRRLLCIITAFDLLSGQGTPIDCFILYSRSSEEQARR